MTQITLKKKTVHTSGSLLKVGSTLPDFLLVNQELEDKRLQDFKGKRKVIYIVPSLDTSVCAATTKKMNELAKKHPGYLFLIISADLPFAQKRFCVTEGVNNIVTLSMIRSKDFGKDYGVLLLDGPLAGLLARALIVVDEQNHVLYSELVKEIADEPNYTQAFHYLKNSTV